MNEVPHGVTKRIDSILASKLLTELDAKASKQFMAPFQ
jgi:hypothetical protein